MLFDVLNGALDMMQKGPRPLARSLSASSDVNGYDPKKFELTDVRIALEAASPGDDVATALRRALAFWDNSSNGDWTNGTAQNCAERRDLIYQLLQLDNDFVELCERKFPFKELDQPVVIAREHAPWYDETARRAHSFYWTAYSRQLAKQGWKEESVTQLDDSTSRIVERLANPAAPEAFQTKGLVVGYVQSGKTANFTGVIAKAADAGYKFIIILAGMLDVLRSQTQRRIDKEMIGQELLDREYELDADWEQFLKHGALPSTLGTFDWYRLTGSESDYQKLGRGVEALQFEASHPGKPLWHKDNLYSVRARVAVVKKNPRVLKRLLSDLRLLQRRRYGAPLDQIPALIIDDESDQAGVNSRPQGANPTNEAIVNLLRLLPRSQYVGYTATPFANVFIDPANEADLFPRDYLLSLPRPDGYMGVSDFYDLDGRDDDPASRPNERDFMRPVTGPDGEADNLVKAIDSYILSGAIKLFRSKSDISLKYRHHTMLVHVSRRTADHDDLAETVEDVFKNAGYDSASGRNRLRALFESDFRQVSSRREPDLPFPNSFESLAPFIGECLTEIGIPSEAILILNNENREQTPDFDRERVWKILVGGDKLSRGYTVEGLTTSYYRRRAQAADTLMQMGRWFGFRRGYRDLVRLFIGTNEPIDRAGRGRINLYAAFGAVCRDEEMFRQELKRYAKFEEKITPLQIPPLVPSHMLRPTASNKMFNARVTYRNFGKRLSESTFSPDDNDDLAHNHAKFVQLIGNTSISSHDLAGNFEGARLAVTFQTAVVPQERVIEFLKAFRWSNSKDRNVQKPLQLQIEFLQGTGTNDPQINDWLIMAPQISSPMQTLEIKDVQFGVVYRGFTEGRFGTYNDPKHRAFAEDIAYGQHIAEGNEAVLALRAQHRGVILYYPVTPTKDRNRVEPPYGTGFTLLFPPNSIRSPIKFGVRRPDLSDQPVVPAA